jgi:hypothetical protein
MTKKNNAQRVVALFFTQLIIGLVFVFWMHTYVLEIKNLPIYNDKIVLSYVVNAVLAIVIFLVLFFLRKKQRDQLGFLFMFGSFLKFTFFFVFFYPGYNEDGDITRLEFMAFFIPYAFSLFVETMSLITLLNGSKKPE